MRYRKEVDVGEVKLGRVKVKARQESVDRVLTGEEECERMGGSGQDRDKAVKEVKRKMRTIRSGAPVIDLTALSFEDQVREYTLRSIILPKEFPSKAVSVRYMYYKGVKELADYLAA